MCFKRCEGVMGKKSAVVLMVLGGILFFFLGLPLIAFYFVSPPPGGQSVLLFAIIFVVLIFIVLPLWMMYSGFSKYRTEINIEKERKALETQKMQIEKERAALEIERIKQQRQRVARGEIDLEKPQVSREREIIKEIVKIRCSYCGKLYDERLDKCPHCGA